jgi:hypothetical protein
MPAPQVRPSETTPLLQADAVDGSGPSQVTDPEVIAYDTAAPAARSTENGHERDVARAGDNEVLKDAPTGAALLAIVRCIHVHTHISITN